jgi:hypothetical protein
LSSGDLGEVEWRILKVLLPKHGRGGGRPETTLLVAALLTAIPLTPALAAAAGTLIITSLSGGRLADVLKVAVIPGVGDEHA